ncbi:MAG: PadR family transcriptional regulator [Solirubrobacteraceae bacterium]|nr:PadR family transcriptional regulator [Solirubrobacteraceae bacterium]
MAVRLTPFSFTILVLVGRGGAGPHDLRRMAEIGRVYWDAAPSQWYAEPKRLAKLGLLTARKEPGRTRERTHYELTDAGREAIAEWARTPAPLPRIQNEPIVRLLAADLVDPAAVLEGLRALSAEIDAAAEGVERSRAGAGDLPARRHLLEVNHRYAERLLALQREWLAEAEAVLSGGGDRADVA